MRDAVGRRELRQPNRIAREPRVDDMQSYKVLPGGLVGRPTNGCQLPLPFDPLPDAQILAVILNLFRIFLLRICPLAETLT